MAIQIDLGSLRPALAELEKRLGALNGRNVQGNEVFRKVYLIDAVKSAVICALIGGGALRVQHDGSVHVKWTEEWGHLEPVLGPEGADDD